MTLTAQQRSLRQASVTRLRELAAFARVVAQRAECSTTVAEKAQAAEELEGRAATLQAELDALPPL